MQYWQIAAGGEGRDYVSAFLRYGMAFVGGHRQTEMMQAVREGDCVVLKEGLSKIVAAGTVVKRGERFSGHAVKDADSKKGWLLHYDGWTLPAYCYVDWRRPPVPVKVKGLIRAAIGRVDAPEVRRAARIILHLRPDATKPGLEPEPDPVENLDRDWISVALQSHSPQVLLDIERYLIKLKRLVARYDKEPDNVREHETRTFLTVPFLLALGWREEQLKIEQPVDLPRRRGRIDVACYREVVAGNKGYRRIALVIETKGYGRGLDSAGEQAIEYARSINCPLAVASNGYRYHVYRRVDARSGPGQTYVHDSYLNLLEPTARYPLDPSNVAGAQEALRHLLPM